MSFSTVLRQVTASRQELDENIAAWWQQHEQTGPALYCAQGCANCCTLAVNCSFPEAIALATTLSQPQASQVLGRLALLEQLCLEAADLKEFLQLHRSRSGGCPFLDAEDNCSCYIERPLSCRALISTRPAAWCGLDFSTLHPLEKKAFLSSLDDQIVAYPSHYLARPLELATRLEKTLDEALAAHYGVKINGNLIWLIGLELKEKLSERLELKDSGIIDRLLELQQKYPYLIQVMED